MPLYDYSCESCSHTFTVRQGFHDDPVAECPLCGGDGRRHLHIPAVVYKGSGFYTTDYGGRRTATSGDFWDKPEHGEEREPGQGSVTASTGDPDSDSSSSHSHPHPHADTTGAHDS
jgi:putative FmdB family regulatory protein